MPLQAKELLNIPRKQTPESSQIKSAGWDKNYLVIEFNSGGIYSYHPVTQIAFTNLITADSVGKYFHSNIKDNKNITFNKIN